MTRTTKLSLKFANLAHRQGLATFIKEYRRVAVLICVKLWLRENLPTYINVKELELETWLSVTSLQACSKQVIAIIKGTRKSRHALRSTVTSAPDCSMIEPCLDSRFFNIDLEPNNSFNFWLNLHSLGNKLRLRFPLKSTRHCNKLCGLGKLRRSICLSLKSVTFIFELPYVEPTQGGTLGIDVGITELAVTSRGRCEILHPHGWTLGKIQAKLAAKRKGSHNFSQTQMLRNNYVGWYINRLNLNDIGLVKLEKICDINSGRNPGRFMVHWPYPLIFHKLEAKCETLGVQVAYINQRNTSRKCSVCGAVDAKSRKGKAFKCTTCKVELNADYNAALNIERSEIISPRRGAHSPSCSRNVMVGVT